MPEKAVLTILDEMPFGQYRGTLVGTVIENDPEYMEWFICSTDVRLDEGALVYLEENLNG